MREEGRFAVRKKEDVVNLFFFGIGGGGVYLRTRKRMGRVGTREEKSRAQRKWEKTKKTLGSRFGGGCLKN